MPGFEDCVRQADRCNYYRTDAEKVMLPSPISEGDPPLSGPRLKAEEEPPGRAPGFSQRLSSKSMAISETPILHGMMTNR